MKLKGLRKTFFTGSNSTCRQHIRQHFELYKQRCETEGIPMSRRAIPPPIWKEMTTSKSPKKQTKLDAHISTGVRPSEFSRDDVLNAVAKFVACDDQVSRDSWGFFFECTECSYIVVSCCEQGNIQELPCHDETEDSSSWLTNHTYCIGTYP